MIKKNIAVLNQAITRISAKAHRQAGQVTIIAASKGRDIEQIKQVINAGITDIGENKVQEALSHYNTMLNAQFPSRIKWHMIGHLQTNKVKEAIRLFDLIQSVDSLALAQEINKQAAKINKVQDILIEVNTSGEARKFGFKPEAVVQAVKAVGVLKNVTLKGLMTIAPIVDDQEKARPYFRKLRELLQEINMRRKPEEALQILSMGMTDDFQAAIEEGATMVRLGRVIFER